MHRLPPSLPLWQGRVSRSTFTTWGLGLFFLKYNLDRLIAWKGFGIEWFPFSYWEPLLKWHEHPSLAATLGLASLPFVYAGLGLTLRRLRDLHWPPLWVGLFFIPGINLLFFGFLCALPSRDTAWQESLGMARVTRLLTSQNSWSSAAISLAATMVLSLPVIFLSASVLENYGTPLFVGLPFVIGLVSALLDGLGEPRTVGRSLAVAGCAIVLAGGLCVAFALEGVICVLMAAPLALPLAFLGAVIGHWLQARRWARRQNDSVRLYVSSAVLLPLLVSLDARFPTTPPLVEATTTVEIDAPPSVVWKHVIAFGDLPPPHESLFLAGIAYPVRARLEGTGVGAIRTCEFSTGPFVEPITVWDENRRLAFDVVQQPHPMREWSPYSHMEPAHLDGFFQSKRGQFLLTPLDGGRRTRLEGTTWYQHDIWPAAYWRLWSDYLIHAIHHRVLAHIATLSETARTASIPPR